MECLATGAHGYHVQERVVPVINSGKGCATHRLPCLVDVNVKAIELKAELASCVTVP